MKPAAPPGPWVLAQRWHHVLFAHWPLPPGSLEPLLPEGLTLDRFDGQAWLGVVPFHMQGVRLRGLPPLPGASVFPELNVRTYVSAPGDDGEPVPGVWFFSLDAGSALAVAVARRWFGLRYYRASMAIHRHGEVFGYACRRTHRGAARALLGARYRPTGEPAQPAAGTLEHFLTERYALYTRDRHGRLRRGHVEHPPWQLQGAEAEFLTNTMALALGVDLPRSEPLLHFAERQDVRAWSPRAVLPHGSA